jgi:hypothetical protein
MRKGDLEGTYAELDFGRMLYLNNVPFRFVVPQGTTGLDYDIEVENPNGAAAMGVGFTVGALSCINHRPRDCRLAPHPPMRAMPAAAPRERPGRNAIGGLPTCRPNASAHPSTSTQTVSNKRHQRYCKTFVSLEVIETINQY